VRGPTHLPAPNYRSTAITTGYVPALRRETHNGAGGVAGPNLRGLGRPRGSDFDPHEVTHLIAQRCAELFDASAGILLSTGGRLSISASSSAEMRRAQLFELQAGEGPCVESYRTGKPVVEPSLGRLRGRWPQFAPAALAGGFRSVHAVPIRAHEVVVGSLNLFRAHSGIPPNADMLGAQALAQATAFTLLRQHEDGPSVPSQPRIGLADQVIIEQAKGTLAGLAAITVDEAIARIRRYAWHYHLQLLDVCQQVVDGDLHLTTFREDNLRRRTHN
jgi:hypothetical protein